GGPTGAAQLRPGHGRCVPGHRLSAPRFGSGGRPRPCVAGRGAGIREPGFRLLPRLPDLLSARAQGTPSSVSAQLWAMAVVGMAVLAAAGLEWFRAWRARRLAAGVTSTASGQPYILYFTGDSCTVCKTHQEPALSRLSDVRIDKVDAVVDRGLAERFHVYTLPTTV